MLGERLAVRLEAIGGLLIGLRAADEGDLPAPVDANEVVRDALDGLRRAIDDAGEIRR